MTSFVEITSLSDMTSLHITLVVDMTSLFITSDVDMTSLLAMTSVFEITLLFFLERSLVLAFGEILPRFPARLVRLDSSAVKSMPSTSWKFSHNC